MADEKCQRRGCEKPERYRGFCCIECKHMAEHSEWTVEEIVAWLRKPDTSPWNEVYVGLADEIMRRWGTG